MLSLLLGIILSGAISDKTMTNYEFCKADTIALAELLESNEVDDILQAYTYCAGKVNITHYCQNSSVYETVIDMCKVVKQRTVIPTQKLVSKLHF